jgi:hypothetical protein
MSSINAKKEKCTEFSFENTKEIDYLEKLDADARIIMR